MIRALLTLTLCLALLPWGAVARAANAPGVPAVAMPSAGAEAHRAARPAAEAPAVLAAPDGPRLSAPERCPRGAWLAGACHAILPAGWTGLPPVVTPGTAVPVAATDHAAPRRPTPPTGPPRLG